MCAGANVCPVGNASPAAIVPARELSSQSAHPWRKRRRPTPRGSPARWRRGHHGRGRAHDVVELLVDVLCLPLPVDRPGALADVGPVTVAVADAPGEPLTQRLDEPLGEHLVGGGDRRGGVGSGQRLRTPDERVALGSRSEFVGDRSGVFGRRARRPRAAAHRGRRPERSHATPRAPRSARRRAPA